MKQSATIIVVAALIGAACTQGTSTTTAPVTSSSTEAPTTTLDSSLPCLAGDIEFADEGTIALFGEAGGDAAVVGGVRWVSYPGCERLVIDLLTGDGSPGSLVGEGAAIFVSPHVIRIELPDSVIDTAVGQFGTSGTAGRGYVVHDADGQIFVDLHITTPTEVRVFDLDAPSRVVVDLLDSVGSGFVGAPPLVSTDVVVVTWTEGFPKAISGYATTDEVVVGSGESFTTVPVSAFPGAWGSFRATVADSADGTVSVVTGAGIGVLIPGS